MYRLVLLVALTLLVPAFTACTGSCSLDKLLKKDFAIEKVEPKYKDEGELTRIDFDMKIVGVETKKNGDNHDVDVTLIMTVAAPDGSDVPLPPDPNANLTLSSDSPIDFLTLKPFLQFPKSFPRGEYTVTFTATDNVANKKAEKKQIVTLE